MRSFNLISVITIALLLTGFYLQWDQSKWSHNLAFEKSEYQCDRSANIASDSPLFEKVFLPTIPETPVVHAPSIVKLSNGDLLAAWFGGAKEGALDVDVHSAKFDNSTKQWSTTRIIAEREQTSAELDRYIKKIGNPVLVMDTQSRIWLFYVTVSIGGWSGSSITYKVSSDQAKTWTRAKRLITSPLINISTLVKGRPLLLENGLIGLPVYHEQFGQFAEYLIIDGNGDVLEKYRITNEISAIQPWLVPTGNNQALALMRSVGNVGNSDPNVLYSGTQNYGVNWSKWKAINLPNPNAAVSAALKPDCNFLQVFNNLPDERNILSMAVSANGEYWKTLYNVEKSDSDKEEYSYPYLIHTGGGEYHLLYTWKRERIAHIRFNEAWLKQQQEAGK